MFRVKVMRTTVRTQILEKPFELSDSQKAAMRVVFDDVMEGLSFYAQSSFIDALFQCPIMILMYDGDNLVGFGTAARREAAGCEVTHIMSAYVMKAYQRKGIMMKCYTYFIGQEVLRNQFCLFKPLYVTASTVNPQVLKAMEQLAPVWPDLSSETLPPARVEKIIHNSIERYYPAGNDVPYQAIITEEMAGVRPENPDHKTGDKGFDDRFFSIADPKNRKLLVFCAKISWYNTWRIFKKIPGGVIYNGASKFGN